MEQQVHRWSQIVPPILLPVLGTLQEPLEGNQNNNSNNNSHEEEEEQPGHAGAPVWWTTATDVVQDEHLYQRSRLAGIPNGPIHRVEE